MEIITNAYISNVTSKNVCMINYALHGRVCGPQRRSGHYDEYKNACCYRNKIQTLSSPQNITILAPLSMPVPKFYCTYLYTVLKLLDTSQIPSDEERR
jgi:hypothetical protein